MLQVQQYERLLKDIVAHNALSGSPERLQAIQSEKVACAHKKTMGTLVGMLTESYLTRPNSSDESSHTDADTGDQSWFRVRFQKELPEELYTETKAALKELVDLRNELVHHFLQRFDLWDASGCKAADAFLDESHETIASHYLTLRDWAKSMDEARALMAAYMQSPEVIDAVENGIWPDGSVHWPISGITACLREAETELAQAGWTHLFEAIRWITKTYPEQTPKRYGCGSWRHVMHESQQFEMRKQTHADDGRSVVWYRSHPRETSKDQEKAMSQAGSVGRTEKDHGPAPGRLTHGQFLR
jgi:hypothetical protein